MPKMDEANKRFLHGEINQSEYLNERRMAISRVSCKECSQKKPTTNDSKQPIALEAICSHGKTFTYWI
ncbi:MAG: hypothetical protein Q8R40_05450 [bacterium]|nr:hypothetical protein [bacterium]